MKKSIKIVLLLSFVVVFACGLSIWAENSPVAYDYEYIYGRDTEHELVMAFATAMRINHPAAYDMIDPSLKPRLDEWMNSHQSQKCKRIPNFFMSEPGTNQGSKTVLSCLGYDGSMSFEVDDIVIRKMKVIDWGEVTEED